MSLQYALVGDMSWQHQCQWQTPDTPFMSFAFWQALIDTGAIGEQVGWLSIFIMIYRADVDDANGLDNADKSFELDHSMLENAQPIAVMPVFIKGHHRGEYVFDHAWAEAYARYGIDYYPRLVTSVPYTPISGERFWLAQGETLTTDIIKMAMAGVDNLAQQVGASSWHGLFVTPEMANLAASSEIEINKFITDYHSLLNNDHSAPINTVESLAIPIFERQGCQFLWFNKNLMNDSQPFADFDDFLMTLTAKKRKNIRAERRKVAAQGIACVRKCGNDISTDDWKTFYHCYVMTYAIRGQQPYLTLDFFMALAKKMPEHLMLAQAYDSESEIIASSLFLYDAAENTKDTCKRTLYGRYWGALGEFDSLHFELCYYQGIEFAIEQGLTHFDPGTQGEHKLIRGFMPTTTHSLHRIYDPRFVPAISDFCIQDREHKAQYREQAHAALPFNNDNMPDFDIKL